MTKTPIPTEQPMPSGGPTVRLSSRAMACEFSVIMNPGSSNRIESARSALERVHDVESWLSIYRADSEISRANAEAADRAVPIRPEFVDLLSRALQLAEATEGAFDVASGQLSRLWKACRSRQELPTDEQIAEALSRSGIEGLELNAAARTIRFRTAELILDPGAIGKGFALDDSVKWLMQAPDAPREFLMHGGHSSLLARGGHFGHPGWPVGIGNPLFTNQRLATVVLQDAAMSTSGSNIQFFRHNGRRYGHILDPRTGWPVSGMLSATVFSPSAATADALSTAFFVLGVEKARLCCEKLPDVGAILIPFPPSGRKLRPEVIGAVPGQIWWDFRQVHTAGCE